MLRPPSFTSARLVYRAPRFPQDEAVFADFLSDPGVLLGAVPTTCKPLNTAELAYFKKVSEEASPGLAVFACLPLSDAEPTKPGEPVGWLNLAQVGEFGGVHRKACFGLFFSAKHSRKGYATEAVEWLLEIAFVSYGLHRLEANCFAWNTAALRVYDKCGFTVEGTRRQVFWQEGGWRDDNCPVRPSHSLALALLD
ncbi:putative GNAT family acetyltransferase [Rhodotorula diobovata]|uniref:Putative GNAT family acetyltransferase n=1 Tax=Rhodotorula diobovata TaxID=5288 RepID=A0A5C5G2M4_9BASI|nr:putative GNAT family acetyltransferase [Rhodotorula diobovata]